MDSDNDFEIADADASKTIPKQCSSLRNGEYVILKGKVCKIVEMFISKPGKHGHAKVITIKFKKMFHINFQNNLNE